jgi:2-desacetyl-2-hydroxyethyl bacteriochlorophyllide A dehydrogenase
VRSGSWLRHLRSGNGGIVRGFVFHSPGVGDVETVKDPQLTPDGVIIEPLVSGVCGTDVHMFYEGTLTQADSLPVVMGHEFVGRVIETGAEATARLPYPDGRGLVAGDLVGVEPMLPCGRCTNCQRGWPNLCTDWGHLGILTDGSWADFVRAPGSRVIRIDADVDVSAVGLLEPLACAVNFVLDKGELQAGQRVVIFGGGPIGLLCAQVALAASAAAVLVVEPSEQRRALARRVGATHTVASGEADEIRDELGTEPDLIVDASGHPAAVATAVALARPGSRLVLAGLGSGALTPMDTNAIVQKELEIRGGFASRWAFGRALALIASNSVDTAALVTKTVPWSQAADVLAELHTGNPSVCKILLSNEVQ